MKKRASYIIIGVGILGILLSYSTVRSMIGLALPASITETTLIIISAIIIAVGLFLGVKKTSHKAPVEVPIYHEDKIVGFRRVHHK